MHLVTKTFDHEEKCPACGFRYATQYDLDEWYDADEEVVCASCLLGILGDLEAEIVISESESVRRYPATSRFSLAGGRRGTSCPPLRQSLALHP